MGVGAVLKEREEGEAERSYHMYSAMILPVQSDRSRLRSSASGDMADASELSVLLLLSPEMEMERGEVL